MAYTDYANTVDPDNWDAALSGLVPPDELYTGAGSTVVGAAGERTHSLEDAWTGGHIDVTSFAFGSGALFVLPVAAAISELYLDAYTDLEPPGVVLYDAAGNRVAATWEVYPDEVVDLSGIEPGRKIFTWAGLLPLTVKAIGFIGYFGYPQGWSRRIYGIYGTQLAGDPPPPEPFWTNFVRASEISA